MAENDEYEAFFARSKVPSMLADYQQKASEFIKLNLQQNRRIALITSGGTTVPLEKNIVRFIDNFSGGGRGSTSTEYFLMQGYAVIFLYRSHSLQPFSRIFGSDNNLFEFLSRNPSTGEAEVRQDVKKKVNEAFALYTETIKAGTLLKIPFTTIADYLHLLRGLAKEMAVCGKQGLVFSAAAVSDFYIPYDSMAEHKIQSSDGPLQLQLTTVPKMLKPLTKEWCPNAFVITFKLETDQGLLQSKVLKALEAYGHQLVIGNLLQSYKNRVLFYDKDKPQPTIFEKTNNEIDLEKYIVEAIVERHTRFINK